MRVVRARNPPPFSLQHRHLCEFHGLDMEMVINEHYYEVLDVFSDLFTFIFDGLNTRFKCVPPPTLIVLRCLCGPPI